MNLDLKNLSNRIKQLQLNKPDNIGNNILIIDGTNNYIRCWSIANQQCIQPFIYSMVNAIQLFSPKQVIITFDGKNSSDKRKKFNSKYKQNRSIKQNCIDSIDQKLKFSRQQTLSKLLILLRELPIYVISIDNIQADDTISYLTRKLKKEYDVVIMSTDRDFYQLVDQNKVSIWNPLKKITIDQKYVVENYNIIPQNFIYLKAVCGDNSDNLPGIKGIGDKTFNKIFCKSNLDKVQVTSYGKLLNEILNNDDLKKYHNLLIQNKFLVQNNITMMDLNSTTFISTSNLQQIKFIMKQQFEKHSEQKLTQCLANFSNVCKRNKLFIAKRDLLSYLHSNLIKLHENIKQKQIQI